MKKFKLIFIALLFFGTQMGCSRKFSRLDSGEAESSGGNFPITPVGQNATVAFNGADSTYTEIPVVYVVDGYSFYTANPGSGAGFDGNLKNMTSLAPIRFTVTPASINIANISVVPYDSSQGSFCNEITFTMQNGFITLNNIQTNRLHTMTSCIFKLTSSSDLISDNQLLFTFNYTVKDWASDLGNGTDAQTTAKAILKPEFSSKSTSLNLTGKVVPDLSPISTLTNLQILNLSNTNTTTIPPSIAQLTNLQNLDLSKNNITTIPPAITQLVNLKVLHLQFNQLSSIPDSISQLTNLTELWLNNNINITSVPASMMQLSKLQNLLLNSNGISIIPNNVYLWLKALQSCHLDGNPGYNNDFENK